MPDVGDLVEVIFAPASSRGNICIDMPSVLELLVQLTFPGPPATQYLPKDFFWLLNMHAHLGFTRSSETFTTSDVTRLFWPRKDGRQFWVRQAEFKGLKESFPRYV